MADYTDEKGSKHLLAEALEYAEFSRRSLLTGATALGAGALGGGLIGTASADEIHVAQTTGKKVRVGVPLTYGPFNQPWRRGCWQVVKNVLDLGGEPVCVRGEPTKASEQSAERTLLDRNIDVLVMGIYSLGDRLYRRRRASWARRAWCHRSYAGARHAGRCRHLHERTTTISSCRGKVLSPRNSPRPVSSRSSSTLKGDCPAPKRAAVSGKLASGLGDFHRQRSGARRPWCDRLRRHHGRPRRKTLRSTAALCAGAGVCSLCGRPDRDRCGRANSIKLRMRPKPWRSRSRRDRP